MNLSLARSLTLAAVMAAPLMATAASPDPSKVEAGTYVIEPSHTRVMFGVDHLGFTTYYGQFINASGTLKLDPKNLGSVSLDVAVPTLTVSTTNLKLDGELKSPDWLDAGKYPAISFKSTKVTPEGADSAKVTGDLTLHGVTKEVTLEAKLHGAGTNPLRKKATVGFDVTGTIKRSDFGVKKYLPLIGDDVELIISAAFEKQS